MYYHSTKYSQLGVINNHCPFCGKNGPALISQKISFIMLLFIIWVWSGGEYLVTCGECNKTYTLSKEEGRSFLSRKGIDPPNLILRNIVAVVIVVGIFLVAVALV